MNKSGIFAVANFKFSNFQTKLPMLIVEVKDNEGIDKALKRYKRKYQKAQVIQELRRRQHFTKPSVKRRNEVLKAQYKQQKQQEEGEV